MIDDLVDIVYPWPENLRVNVEHAEKYFDPLLEEIGSARREMRETEVRMRLLVAYDREFVRPQPSQLKDLAAATGMSISGTRSAYDGDEIEEVARRLGRPPRPRKTPADTTVAAERDTAETGTEHGQRKPHSHRLARSLARRRLR